MVAAPEEPHFAIVVERGPDLDPAHDVLAMHLFDVRMGHLDEVCALEHRRERLHELPISALERGQIEAGMRVELGIEVEIGVAQMFEPVEIFIVIDRPEQAADPAEFFALLLARELPMLDQRVEDIDLADRNEMAAVVLGAAVAARIDRRHGSAL